MRAARIAQAHLVLALVVEEQRIVLVRQGAIAQLGSAAERRRPADAQAVTLRARVVALHALVAAPVPEGVVAVGVTEGVDAVLEPRVLPLRHLVSEVEAIPQPRQVEPRGQRGVAHPPAFLARAVFAGILKVDGEGVRGREHELAGQRGRLIAEIRVGPGVVAAQRVEKPTEQTPQRLVTVAAAVLQDAAGAHGPAAHRVHRDLHAEESRIAASDDSRLLGDDVLGARRFRHEHLVAQAEFRHRRVIRQRDARHRWSLRADEHAAVGHGRPPMVAEAHIQLRVFEPEAQQRAACRRFLRICNAAELHQYIVGRLIVGDERSRPGVLRQHAATVRQRARRILRCSRLDAGMGNCVRTHVRLQISAHALTQRASTLHASGNASRTVAAAIGRRTIG